MSASGPFTSYMSVALEAARRAAASGEAPIGAAIVDPIQGAVIAVAGNETRSRPDPTAHAEILVIRAAAAKLGRERLSDLDLWVTLEPCPMCAGAIAHARLKRLYYGASDPKGGGVESGPRVFHQPTTHHRPEIYAGIAAEASAALLKSFFEQRR